MDRFLWGARTSVEISEPEGVGRYLQNVRLGRNRTDSDAPRVSRASLGSSLRD